MAVKRYVCSSCGYIYDPARGDLENDVAPGTAFESLPEGFVCPKCGAEKHRFSAERKGGWELYR